MKVGIIQFSDIHFKNEKDVLLSRKDSLFFAAKAKLTECKKIIVAVSGDISFSGKEEEYKIAKQFFRDLASRLKIELSLLSSIDYVFVPGNHDCCLEEEAIRSLVVNNVLLSDTLESEEITNSCLSVQDNFWAFYSDLIGEKMAKSVSNCRECSILQDCSIYFHCYNTALLSVKNETPGRLLVPENRFISKKVRPKDITISLFHHNTGWLSSSTPSNNKKRFEYHLLSQSNIIMCGHEHDCKNNIITDLNDSDSVLYLEGPALQSGSRSSFLVDVIDTEDRTMAISKFEWDSRQNIYSSLDEKVINLKVKDSNLIINPDFSAELERLSIPIKHPQKGDMILSDVFVYPDLEPLAGLNEKITHYYDSEQLTSESADAAVYFIEGEPQSGKTSLLKRLFQAFALKGKLPLLLNGSDIVNPNLSPVIKRAYKEQYNYRNTSFEVYQQCPKSDKILLIDSFEKTVLNNNAKGEMFERLENDYSLIILTSDDQTDIRSLLIQTGQDTKTKRYHLLPLGYHKRNLLIEKWVKLGKNLYTINDAVIEHEVKLLFDQITSLLGEQLIPAYPVFVLSLLQGLNQAVQQFDVSQTSYAFCYKSLIIGALFRSGVDGSAIEGVINFLTELAYNIYSNKVEIVNRDYYDRFFDLHYSKYNRVYSSERLLAYLCNSNILREEGGSFVFSYKYIYYYLIAAKISTLGSREKNSLVKKLCESLHKEDAANILIFLIHHNRSDSNELIEELLFTSLLPFEDYPAITLGPEDPLFKNLRGFVSLIKQTILIDDVDPHAERTKALKEADNKIKMRNNTKSLEEKDFENDPDYIDINNTFKIIRILGQIVKNQRDTFKKDDLSSLIEHTYNTCFRSISFITKLIDDNKKDIVDYLIDKNRKLYNMPEKYIEEQVGKLIHSLLYRTCLSAFSNLSMSVGNTGMDDIFDDVANHMNTPAAKIISFTIKTYYNRMTPADLRQIVESFKDNVVAMQIIRARVIHYVYNNSTDYQTRQVLGALCGLSLVNKATANKIRK